MTGARIGISSALAFTVAIFVWVATNLLTGARAEIAAASASAALATAQIVIIATFTPWLSVREHRTDRLTDVVALILIPVPLATALFLGSRLTVFKLLSGQATIFLFAAACYVISRLLIRFADRFGLAFQGIAAAQTVFLAVAWLTRESWLSWYWV